MKRTLNLVLSLLGSVWCDSISLIATNLQTYYLFLLVGLLVTYVFQELVCFHLRVTKLVGEVVHYIPLLGFVSAVAGINSDDPIVHFWYQWFVSFLCFSFFFFFFFLAQPGQRFYLFIGYFQRTSFWLHWFLY